MAASATRKPGLTIVTAAFAAMLLAANLATPLYAVYARKFGFSTVVLALVFAVYALVLIPALLLFGQLSDRLGRRPVIAPGEQRAEVSAAFYVCIYLGVSLPVIGIGILADLTTLFTAVTTFAVVTGACALVLAAWHLRRGGGTPATTSHRTEDTGRTLRDLIPGGTR